MTQIVQFFQQHWGWFSEPVALWIYSWVIHSMPTPQPMGNPFYTWLYNVLQIIGANKALVGAKNGIKTP